MHASIRTVQLEDGAASSRYAKPGTASRVLGFWGMNLGVLVLGTQGFRDFRGVRGSGVEGSGVLSFHKRLEFMKFKIKGLGV